MQINSSLNNGCLSIIMPDHIDTSNAGEVEESITPILDEHPDVESLVFDAKDLNYISSVGLRLVLKMKKRYEDFKVINVNGECYEIFQMTGFTDIITIEKALRVISIEGKPIIGEGYYGKVYRISPDMIVKHYFRNNPIDDIDRERKLARLAFTSGIPTAIAFDVVAVKEGGYGAVYECIDAESFKSVILKDMEHLDKYIDINAKLIKNMNATEFEGEGLPRSLDIAKEWLARIKPIVSDALYNRCEKLMATIPDDHRLIHGDCHFKNIFIQDGEPLLIDMDSLQMGSPIFECASLYIAYCAYELDDPGNALKFMGVDGEITRRIYEGTVERIYADRGEAQIAVIKKKILALALIHFLSKIANWPDKQRIQKTINRLQNAVDDVKDLTI